MKMREAVNSPFVPVESRGDQVEVARIAGVIPAEYRVCDVVGQLNRARGMRLHEQRCVGNVPRLASPLIADGPEITGDRPQAGFIGTAIENDHPPLPVRIRTGSGG